MVRCSEDCVGVVQSKRHACPQPETTAAKFNDYCTTDDNQYLISIQVESTVSAVQISTARVMPTSSAGLLLFNHHNYHPPRADLREGSSTDIHASQLLGQVLPILLLGCTLEFNMAMIVPCLVSIRYPTHHKINDG